MKRTFQITISLIFVAIIVTGIVLWRNHYLKIMNAEPVKVYKSTPFESEQSPKETTIKQKKADKSTQLDSEKSPKDTSVKSDENTDIASDENVDVETEPHLTTEPVDNSATPEATDNMGDPSAGTIFADLAGVNLPPEAAAALKKYEEIQLAIPVLNTELKPLLKATPIDWDAIGVIHEKSRELREQRKDALETLSLYSDDALAELQATIARGKAAERIVNELDKMEI